MQTAFLQTQGDLIQDLSQAQFLLGQSLRRQDIFFNRDPGQGLNTTSGLGGDPSGHAPINSDRTAARAGQLLQLTGQAGHALTHRLR
jgi:hypothetical protein